MMEMNRIYLSTIPTLTNIIKKYAVRAIFL